MSENNFKITFLLPTCEPDEMFAHLYPSLPRIVKGRNFLQFAICFQPPYTDDQITKVITRLSELGFEYKYMYKDYQVVKPYTPLIKMRNDCAMLYPDSDAYALLDDDMSFESMSVVYDYLEAARRFQKDEHLAVVALNNYPRQYENYFATNQGVCYRGGKYYGFQGLVPEYLHQIPGFKTKVPYQGENLLNLFGGFQDKFCGMIRLCNGDKLDQVSYVKVKHVENRKQRGAQGHGWESAKYQEGSIGHFIQKYFNRYFLCTCTFTLFEADFMEQLHPDYYLDSTPIFEYR